MFFWFLLFFIILVFVVLVAILKKILTGNVITATQHLEQLSQSYLKKQDEVKKRLEEAKQISQKRLAETREEVEKIKIDALIEVNRQKDEILETARKQGEEKMRQGEKARENLIMDMEKNIKIKAIGITSELIKNALSDEVKKIIHVNLVDKFINHGLGKLKRLQAEKDLEGVKILSAFELREKEYELIINELSSILTEGTKFDKEVSEDLIGGLVIKIGSLVIDASFKWDLQEQTKNILKKEK